MLYREISRVLGQYLFGLSLILCFPLALSGYYEFIALASVHPQPHSTGAFFSTVLFSGGISALLTYWGNSSKGVLYRREALAVVAMIWFISAIIGGLPFYFSGTFEHFIDAYFEAMSGLTTTGASVMHAKIFNPQTGSEIPHIVESAYGSNITYTFLGTIQPVRSPETGLILFQGIEAVSKGLLFWRSLMQWLGGMGIVVLFVAILPALGVGGRVLYQAEVPGPTKEAVTPRIKETASLLWKLYLGLTFLEIGLLLWTNQKMPILDAVCITLSNLSTGGFSIRNASIASYESSATEHIVLAFMLIGSINFTLYFYCLKGKIYRLYEPEFIIYLCTIIVGVCFISWHLIGSEKNLLTGERGIYSIGEAFRYGAFHFISAQTSTGFVTSDFNLWPPQNQVVLLLIMFVGSMSGSTGGGIKIVRHYMLFRIAKNKIESIFRPETVRTFRIGNHDVDDKAAVTVLTFFFIILSLSVAGTLFMVIDGVDPETALSVNTCMINNIGLAFRAAGPTESFAFLSPASKMLSSIFMVLGRLEFFALLIVFVPAFWKGK